MDSWSDLSNNQENREKIPKIELFYGKPSNLANWNDSFNGPLFTTEEKSIIDT